VKILNAAFYRFVAMKGPLEPSLLRPLLKAEAASRGLRGTLLLAPEGLNGSLAGEPTAVRGFLEFLRGLAGFEGLEAKESFSEAQPFGRLLVRLKKEIITMGVPDLDPLGASGKRLAPAELKRWLDEGREFELLDTRNDFEVAAGTFQRAWDLGLQRFGQFPQALEAARERLKGKPVVMFCTGGIRCEKSTALALRMGLDDVYQLEGGILKYFEDCGEAHYRGRCVVFDDRESLGADLRESGKLRQEREEVSSGPLRSPGRLASG
jgi:UPF0176 protein